MKGQYQNKKGDLLKVRIFDEANEMVYAENKIGQCHWYHKPQYSTWVNTADNISKPAVPQSKPIVESAVKEIKKSAKSDTTSKK